MVQAHRRHTEMLVNNVLQNAVNYGQSLIKVRLKVVADFVWFIVEDDGPGIPSADRIQVLKPFVRGNATRRGLASHRGFGMGLAIVDRIASWHGARLKIESSDELAGAAIHIGFRTAGEDHG